MKKLSLLLFLAVVLSLLSFGCLPSKGAKAEATQSTKVTHASDDQVIMNLQAGLEIEKDKVNKLTTELETLKGSYQNDINAVLSKLTIVEQQKSATLNIPTAKFTDNEITVNINNEGNYDLLLLVSGQYLEYATPQKFELPNGYTLKDIKIISSIGLQVTQVCLVITKSESWQSGEQFIVRSLNEGIRIIFVTASTGGS